MRDLRQNEPIDPQLRAVSKVLPDRWLDERWPQRRAGRQGRWQGLRTSQLVRVHLLALIKALGSFNRACQELKHNVDFRRFCRLGPNDAVPTAGFLSKFRTRFGVAQWRQLHLAIVRVLGPSVAGMVVLDSSDLPAAVRRTWKKKTDRR
jgi:hypothetical protein